MSGLQPIEAPNERQGDYIDTTLYVWRCDDDVCDCAQVVVERRYWNRCFRGAYWTVRIWEGEFVSAYANDSESRATVTRDLLAAWRAVREAYPDEKWGSVTFPKPER